MTIYNLMPAQKLTPAQRRRLDEMLANIERRRNHVPVVVVPPRSDGLNINPSLLLPDGATKPLDEALARLDEVLGRADVLRAEIAAKGKAITTATPKDEKCLLAEIAAASASLRELPDLAYFHWQYSATQWFTVVRSAVEHAAARLAEAPPEDVTTSRALNAAWTQLEKYSEEARTSANAAVLCAEYSAQMAQIAHQIDALRPEYDKFCIARNKLAMVPQLVDMALDRVLGISADQTYQINEAARKYARKQVARVFN